MAALMLPPQVSYDMRWILRRFIRKRKAALEKGKGFTPRQVSDKGLIPTELPVSFLDPENKGRTKVVDELGVLRPLSRTSSSGSLENTGSKQKQSENFERSLSPPKTILGYDVLNSSTRARNAIKDLKSLVHFPSTTEKAKTLRNWWFNYTDLKRDKQSFVNDLSLNPGFYIPVKHMVWSANYFLVEWVGPLEPKFIPPDFDVLNIEGKRWLFPKKPEK